MSGTNGQSNMECYGFSETPPSPPLGHFELLGTGWCLDHSLRNDGRIGYLYSSGYSGYEEDAMTANECKAFCRERVPVSDLRGFTRNVDDSIYGSRCFWYV